MEIIQGSHPVGVFDPSRNDQARYKTETVLDALVVDVITDHLHPEYSSDGYNVGAAKIRILSVDVGVSNDALPWAFPKDSIVIEYPLIGEMVTIERIRGILFYSKKIPIARRVQENAALKLPYKLDARGSRSIKNFIQNRQQPTRKEHLFGRYYKPDSRVRPIKHFEGDVILQNRLGTTIRMGSSTLDPTSKGLAPNLILRAGQAKDIEFNNVSTDSVFGLITENLEKDPSSIWLVSDQKVPFLPITNTIGSYGRSLKNTEPVNLYRGAQIFVNSDKLVLNAKNTHILLFAREEIYLNAYRQIGIDTDGSVEISANKEIYLESNDNIKISTDSDLILTAGTDLVVGSINKTSLFGNKIFIGTSTNAYEPVVGGTSLSIFLARLILTLMGSGITPPQIPYQSTGSPIPPLAGGLPSVATPGVATTAHVLVVPGAPAAALNPVIAAGLAQLYAELAIANGGSSSPIPFSGAPFNSSDIFTTLATEDPTQLVQLNEFEEGSPPPVIENNSYNLSDNYYKVV